MSVCAYLCVCVCVCVCVSSGRRHWQRMVEPAVRREVCVCVCVCVFVCM